MMLLDWYVHKVRPGLSGEANCDAMFVTANGGKLSPNGIGERLRVAARAAGVRSGVARWESWAATARGVERAKSSRVTVPH